MVLSISSSGLDEINHVSSEKLIRQSEHQLAICIGIFFKLPSRYSFSWSKESSGFAAGYPFNFSQFKFVR